jgi:two-component system, sensor histidine kinase PdtaS
VTVDATLPAWLSAGEADHLQALMASWGMLADLCFADLLLLVPDDPLNPNEFIVAGQVRPSTNPTLYREDMVGRGVPVDDRPVVKRSWTAGQIVEEEVSHLTGERVRLQCIPVRGPDRRLAVMTRESATTVGRRQGELERVYVETFDRFARMIVNGEFPFHFKEEVALAGESPRVGDGVLVVDDKGRIVYASPNAVSALHRLGVTSNFAGARLEELGVEATSVSRALDAALPITEEVERRPDFALLVQTIPLLVSGKTTGAVVLVRDVTDLRRRDRLLVSKDATIREVHHRVKNNLQTISSLLRLQARRLGPGGGRTALEEAERRIRSIALVHEILSRDPGDQVAFGEILRELVHMASEAAASFDRPVRIRTEGTVGEVPAEVATPLAVVVAELLQNAVEHAFAGPGPWANPEDREVGVAFDNDGEELRIRVWDNGVGLPEGFDVSRTVSLGLSLVRDLVITQLQGQIMMGSDGGTRVALVFPLPSPTNLG